MNKRLKKLISFVLCMIMLFSVAIPAFAASTQYATDLPVVYVRGREESIYSADGKEIYPYEKTTEEYVKDSINPIMDALKKSLMTNNWEGYYNAFYDAILPIYKDVIPSKSGDVTDGSHIDHQTDPKFKIANYDIDDYWFRYDWRLDPCALADELNQFIQLVKERTGKEKVNLIGRCFGGNIVSAYLEKYGDKDVEQVLLYASTAKGVETCGVFFSGKIKFTPSAIDTYLSCNESEDDATTNVLKAIVSILRQVEVLGYGTSIVNDITKKVIKNVLPRIIRESYGAFPAYWSMVGDEYFEDAKKFVFAGYEDEYAGLIEKIDNYHYNVQNNLEKNYTDLVNGGMKMSNICKYDINMPPFFSGSEKQADGKVELVSQSLGATSASIGRTLGKTYIEEAKAAETIKYISADEKIDASTCVLPDTTWFIKDLEHGDAPAVVDEMIMTILRADGQMTVWDNEQYPQYIEYDKDAGTLAAVSGRDKADQQLPVNIVQAFVKFLVSIIEYLLSIFKK